MEPSAALVSGASPPPFVAPPPKGNSVALTKQSPGSLIKESLSELV